MPMVERFLPRSYHLAAPTPQPPPPLPWVLAQTWHDLLFAHWPVDTAVMQGALPSPFAPDTFAGHAWLGVVPFWMSGVRARGLPAIPWLSRFPELNVRTYVTVGGRPGVFFFSLDAARLAAVIGARLWMHLPYFHARMRVRVEGDVVAYRSHRIHRGAPAADFRARYRPAGPVFHAAPGSLEHFLTARFSLYTLDGHRRVVRADIWHAPWPLQPATAEITVNSMAEAHGILLPDTPPLLHVARRLDVVVAMPRRLALLQEGNADVSDLDEPGRQP
jgi:uncharacterized protein YqjF (DUF2071 family)